MKYLILNHIRGSLRCMESVLVKEEGNFDEVLIIGDICGNYEKSNSEGVLQKIFKLSTISMCNHVCPGAYDQMVITQNLLELPEGAQMWMKTMMPVDTWESEGFHLIMLTGTPEMPFRGVYPLPVPPDKYWADDPDFEIVILGNNLDHAMYEATCQTIICPGPIFEQGGDSIKYALLDVTQNRVNCEFKEIVRIF